MAILYRAFKLVFKLNEETYKKLEELQREYWNYVSYIMRGIEVDNPKLTSSVKFFAKRYLSNFPFVKPPKKWLIEHSFVTEVLREIDGQKRGTKTSLLVLCLRSTEDKVEGKIALTNLGLGKSLTLELDKYSARRLYEEIRLGADVTYAMFWVEKKRLYIVLVLSKPEPPKYEPKSLIAVDVNSWHHGIAWGFIRDGKLICFSVERPDLRKIEKLYEKAVMLERKWGRLKRLGLDKTVYAKRIRREARRLRRKIYAIIRDKAQKLVHKLVTLALNNKAKIIVDDVPDVAIRELVEELLNDELAKIYLAGLRRFVKLLEHQCKWYGIPFEKRRLPSTICPRCGAKLIEQESRIMLCPKCGLREQRDKIPIIHVLERTR